jgi:hypothetical protein
MGFIGDIFGGTPNSYDTSGILRQLGTLSGLPGRVEGNLNNTQAAINNATDFTSRLQQGAQTPGGFMGPALGQAQDITRGVANAAPGAGQVNFGGAQPGMTGAQTAMGNLLGFQAPNIGTAQYGGAQGTGQALNATQSLLGTQGPDYSAANQTVGQMGGLTNQLLAQGRGEGPNPALDQLRMTTDSNVRQANALAASQRGSNPGALARLAGQTASTANQQAAGQAALQRAQQTLAAQQAAGTLGSGMANLQAGMAQTGSGQRLAALGQAGQLGTGLAGLGLQGTLGASGQQLGAQQAAGQLGASLGGLGTQQGLGSTQALLSALGLQGGMGSQLGGLAQMGAGNQLGLAQLGLQGGLGTASQQGGLAGLLSGLLGQQNQTMLGYGGLGMGQAAQNANINAGTTAGLLNMAGSGLSALGLMSDERAKTDIHRHTKEVIPGVPEADWRWKGTGEKARGVIAQDLERVAPEYVHTGPEGLKRVDPAFAPVRAAYGVEIPDYSKGLGSTGAAAMLGGMSGAGAGMEKFFGSLKKPGRKADPSEETPRLENVPGEMPSAMDHLMGMFGGTPSPGPAPLVPGPSPNMVGGTPNLLDPTGQAFAPAMSYMQNSQPSMAPGWGSMGSTPGPTPNVMPMDVGGQVPGQARRRGDDPQNDTVDAKLSPGEIVLPRSVAQDDDAPEAAAEFVAAIKAKKTDDRPSEAAPDGFAKVLARQRELERRLGEIEKFYSGGKSGGKLVYFKGGVVKKEKCS